MLRASGLHLDEAQSITIAFQAYLFSHKLVAPQDWPPERDY